MPTDEGGLGANSASSTNSASEEEKKPQASYAELVRMLPSLADLGADFEDKYDHLGTVQRGVVRDYIEIEAGKAAKDGYDRAKAKARMEKMYTMLRKQADADAANCTVL